jgi:hypothetical protein
MYQMFKVNEDILTQEYSNKIAFLVKGLSHKIDSKGWETHIETMGVPKTTLSTSVNQPNNPVITTTINSPSTQPDNSPTYPSAPPTNVPGAWRVFNAGKEIFDARDLAIHHNMGGYRGLYLDPYDPNTNPDGNRRLSTDLYDGKSPHGTGHWWSYKSTGAGRNYAYPNINYLYDIVLVKNDGGVNDRNCWVPSPVDGVVTSAQPNARNSYLSIKSDGDGRPYVLIHGDTFQVKVGDRVKRGQYIMRQSNKMSNASVAPNYHLHLEWPNKFVLFQYINDLVNDTFPK